MLALNAIKQGHYAAAKTKIMKHIQDLDQVSFHAKNISLFFFIFGKGWTSSFFNTSIQYLNYNSVSTLNHAVHILLQTTPFHITSNHKINEPFLKDVRLYLQLVAVNFITELIIYS